MAPEQEYHAFADVELVDKYRADGQVFDPREEDQGRFPSRRRRCCCCCNPEDQRCRIPPRVSAFVTLPRGCDASAGFQRAVCRVYLALRDSFGREQEPGGLAPGSSQRRHRFRNRSYGQRGGSRRGESSAYILGRTSSAARRGEGDDFEPEATNGIIHRASSTQDRWQDGFQGAVADGCGDAASTRRRAHSLCGSSVVAQLPACVLLVLIGLGRDRYTMVW